MIMSLCLQVALLVLVCASVQAQVCPSNEASTSYLTCTDAPQDFPRLFALSVAGVKENALPCESLLAVCTLRNLLSVFSMIPEAQYKDANHVIDCVSNGYLYSNQKTMKTFMTALGNLLGTQDNIIPYAIPYVIPASDGPLLFSSKVIR